MTTTAMSQHSGRTTPTAAHSYSIPIVRELPTPRVENFDSRTW